jgi:excisionase family DNA binding protein
MTFGQVSISNSLINKKMDEILERLRIIEKHVLDQNLILKNVLNFNEACQYLELSQSHLYKLTSAGSIPYYKPNGKKLYFNRVELDQWLLRNRNSTQDEIDQRAADYLIKKGRVKL